MSVKLPNLSSYFDLKYDAHHNREKGICNMCSHPVFGRTADQYWSHLYSKHSDIMPDKFCVPRKRNLSSSSSPNNAADVVQSIDDHSVSASQSQSLDSINHSNSDNYHPSLAKQIKLTSIFPPISPSEVLNFHNLLIRFFSNNGIPHSFLENNDFIAVISAAQKFTSIAQIFPQRKAYRSLVLARGNEIFTATLSKLASRVGSPPQFVTLAIDGWTGQKFGSKNTNTIALCKGESYLLWSDKNDDDFDSAETYLFPLLAKQIAFLLKTNVIISSLTTDNASNMIQLGTRLYQIPEQGKAILHISCSAHTIQLMIEKIVDLKPVATYIQEALKLIDAFTTAEGKKYRLLIRKYQLNNEIKAPLKLIMYNQTRWLSRLLALERLCTLKSAIQFISLNGGADERKTLSVARLDIWWNKLSTAIIPFLTTFQKAMNVVQSDSSTLFDLNVTLNTINQSIVKCNFSDSIGCAKSTEDKFIQDSKSIVDSYVNSYISSTDHHAFTAVSILTDSNFPPPAVSSNQVKQQFKHKTKEATNWISEWGADFISFYKKYFPHINCDNKNDVTGEIIKQLTMFEGSIQDFDDKSMHKDLMIKSRKNNEQKSEKEVDWKLFWTKYYQVCPHLSIIALCLLSVGISEACVERSFSIQKLTHSDSRNRMKEDIVEAEMRIRFNKLNMNDQYADEILKAERNCTDYDIENELSDAEDLPIDDDDVQMNF